MTKKSFTLIETVMAISALGILIILIFSLIFSLYKTQAYGWEQSLAIEEAKRGIKLMTREIRESVDGQDGSYLIEKANDRELIFYGDIDKDGEIERVRYFVGSVSGGSLTEECFSYDRGGWCGVSFSQFLQGEPRIASLEVSVEGDFGLSAEYANIEVDGNDLGNICQSSCSDCPGVWQGTSSYDVLEFIQDGVLDAEADASYYVDDTCDWEQTNHSIKAKFTLTWQEEINEGNSLKKGVTDPTSSLPAEYNPENEEVSVVSSYIINGPSIFTYFDGDGNEIEDAPARLIDTKMVKVRLIINVNPETAPDDFELESFVQLRNLSN